MLEKLQERIAEITKSIEQVVANHNFLTGALQEANNAVQAYVAHRDEINKIVEDIPENPIEAVIETIELIEEVVDNNEVAA